MPIGSRIVSLSVVMIYTTEAVQEKLNHRDKKIKNKNEASKEKEKALGEVPKIW